VVYCAPHWICEGAAYVSYAALEAGDPALNADSWRLAAMQRMAWAQWSLAEIASGEPFRRLLA